MRDQNKRVFRAKIANRELLLASLKYGWRDVPKKLADGRIKVERVPFTLDDVVHPQFGDVHVLSDAHDDDCSYMKDVLKDRYRDDASVVVFSDCGIFWDKPGLRHHSPDLARRSETIRRSAGRGRRRKLARNPRPEPTPPKSNWASLPSKATRMPAS